MLAPPALFLNSLVAFCILFTLNLYHKYYFFLSLFTFFHLKNSLLNYLPMDSPPSSTLTSPRKGRRERNLRLYKGVRVRTWGKWVSEIRVPKTGKRIWLGSYDTPEKAARAYDAALYCIRGEHGPFNFPADKRPELPEGSADPLSMKDIKAIATNFASSDASVSSQTLSSVATQESMDAPASPCVPAVSNATGSACEVVNYVPSVTGAATVSVENLQLDDFLMLDIEWISDFL